MIGFLSCIGFLYRIYKGTYDCEADICSTNNQCDLSNLPSGGAAPCCQTVTPGLWFCFRASHEVMVDCHLLCVAAAHVTPTDSKLMVQMMRSV
jgi:hypothetical protein